MSEDPQEKPKPRWNKNNVKMNARDSFIFNT